MPNARRCFAAGFLSSIVILTTSFITHSASAGPMSAPTWSGLYVGMNGGYGWSGIATTFDDFQLPALGTGFSRDVNGGLVGAHLGLQQQFGPIVVGVEATFDGGKLDGTASGSSTDGTVFCGPGCVISDQESWKTEIDSIYTVTGRIGYSLDRWLVYGKGGFASAEIRQVGAVNAQFPGCVGCGFAATAPTEARHNGWVAGAGAEYMIHPHVTLGFEYDYISLESKTVGGIATVTNGGGIQESPVTLGVNPDPIQTAMARLTILLNTPDRENPPLK